MRIKKGDKIKVLSGKDRGKIGSVLTVLPKKGKILVEGINIIKKHSKPKKEGEKGQLIEKPAPFPISKAMLICPHCSKPTRVTYIWEGENKIRACKKCGKGIK